MIAVESGVFSMKWFLYGLLVVSQSAAFAALVPVQQENLKQKAKTSIVQPSAELIMNWGLFNQNHESHIDALRAWKISKGDHAVKVAIIDTGCDEKHPMLSQNILHNSSGGFGWDFVTNTNKPKDQHGHGSHVAAIVTSVAPKVSIICVKYYSETASGTENLNNTIKAINFAIEQKVDIINYSGGGSEFDKREHEAIKRAEKAGILFVAAAGNEANDIDNKKSGAQYFPGAYDDLDNILTVAATDIKNELVSSTNFGKKNVDVAAPGENIRSALHKGNFGMLTGSSQATAFVTGLAALVKSVNKNLSYAEVKKIIMSSVDKLPNLQNKIASGGRINAYTALRTTLAMKEQPSVSLVASYDLSQRNNTDETKNTDALRKVAEKNKQ